MDLEHRKLRENVRQIRNFEFAFILELCEFFIKPGCNAAHAASSSRHDDREKKLMH